MVQAKRSAAARGERLAWRISTAVAVTMVVTLVAGLMLIVMLVDAHDQAEADIEDLAAYRLVLSAAGSIMAERAPANRIMREAPASDGPTIARLAAARSRADAALDRLADAGSRRPDAKRAEWQRVVADVHASLAEARGRVDALAARPLDERRLAEVQAVIDRMIAVAEVLRPLVAAGATELGERDGRAASAVMLSRLMSELRDYASRVGFQLANALAANQPLDAEQARRAERSRVRLNELWLLAGHQPALAADDPRIAEARRDVERRFFGDGARLIDTILAEGRRGGDYSLTVQQLVERYVPTLEPVERLRDLLLDTLTRQAMTNRDSADSMLTVVATLTFAAMVLQLVLFLSVRLFVLRPLRAARDEVMALVGSPLDELGRALQAAGGNHDLFDALDVLRARQDEWQRQTERLKREAETDALTGLLNRRVLNHFGQDLVDCAIVPGGVGLILFDVDHFKAVNDRYGHLVGDRVLREVAATLRAVAGEDDICARFGGEEFAVLAPGYDLDDTIALARRIRHAVEQREVVLRDGTRIQVTASFGVAVSRPGADDWLQLVAVADRALYRAKAAGRNCVRTEERAAAAPLPLERAA